MAENDQIVGHESQQTSRAPVYESPAVNGPVTMMDNVRSSIGGPALQRKLARRLARKAEGRVALDAITDSFQGSNAVASQIARDGTPQMHTPTEVANQGFAGAAQEVPYRSEMEQSFGADFSGVRAYTGSSASSANAALSSHAYAMGDQVAFRDASPSKSTVAHELTHVLQQTQSPSYKSDDESGIDTAGEHEAEAVEAAVSSGRPASSALSSARPSSGGAALKAVSGPSLKGARPAREGEGSKFGIGMTFSKEAFEESFDYTIWKGHYAWPIGVPGINFVVDPSVKVSAKAKANTAGKEAGAVSMQLGVFGEVGLGLSGGIPDVAEVYGTLNPGLEGSFTYVKEAPEAEGGAGGKEGEQGKEKAGKWHLEGAITLKAAAKIGISLLGGIIDQAYELGSIDIGKFTGVYFDSAGFHKDKVGFEWGQEIKAAWAAIQKAIDKAKHMGKAAVQAAKDAGHAITKKAASLGNWVSSWF